MSSTPVQRAITEAIESIASTEARVSILVRALGRAGLARVPERGPEVLRFVEGPLVDAIVERLGTGVADQIVEQLRPVLRFVSQRPSSRPAPALDTRRPPPAAAARPEATIEPRPTIRVMDPAAFDRASSPDPFGRPTVPDAASLMATPVPPPSAPLAVTPAPPSPAFAQSATSDASGARPRPPPTPTATVPAASLFILASLDDALVDAVEARSVALRVVRGLFELVDAAEDARDRTTTLVFDCASPPVHIASLLALAADMPATVQVALLGASPLDLQALASAPERTVGWAYLQRLTPGELAGQIQAAASASRASTG